jgi:hypothetical protein
LRNHRDAAASLVQRFFDNALPFRRRKLVELAGIGREAHSGNSTALRQVDEAAKGAPVHLLVSREGRRDYRNHPVDLVETFHVVLS